MKSISGRTNTNDYMAKKYSTSGELMKEIRNLDYHQQYKVCEKFYRILKGLHEDSRIMYQRFYESFELIAPENLEEYMVELHWAINDMDNALYESDAYTPMEFFEIAEALTPVIRSTDKRS